MLTNLDNVVRYVVSGETYSIPFPYWTTEEIKAYITLSDESVEELTSGTDFTVTTPDGVSGTLTKVTAWTDAEKLTIVREVELTQEIDLINGEKIDGEQLETGLDLKTAGLQQLNEKFTRSVMTSIDETGDNMVIPNSTARKGTGDGTLLGFDGTGGNIVLRDLKQFDADVANTATNAGIASAAASNALASENKAQKWAEEAEDVPVEPSKYSAKHWATKASASATASESSSEDSEAWAVGTRDGSPVSPSDPTYHNSSKYYHDIITQIISGALRYQGTWTTTSQTDYSAISTPRLKGDLYYCQGTATTIDGVTYTQGDLIIFNQDVAQGTTITTSMIDKIDNTETVTPDNTCTLSNKTIAFNSNTMTDVAGTSATQTLTNKEIDRSDNTIKNTPTVVSTTQTITPTKEMNVVIDTASITVTLDSGAYIGQRVDITASAVAVIAYNTTKQITTVAGQLYSFTWNGSTWKLGHLKVKLWDNPSKSSAFSAQQIGVPKAFEYDKLLFEFKGYTGYSNKCGFTQITDTTFQYASVTWSDIYSGLMSIYGRAMVANSLGYVDFRDAFYWDYGGTPAADNDRMIPLAIYGLIE